MSEATAKQAGSASEHGFGSLTARESELLRKAGDRIFQLSRSLADSERTVQRLEQELAHTRELLAETRSSRDVLSSQVSSLHRDMEREYVERSELRRLLASFQMHIQSLLTPGMPVDARPRLGQGREAPQRSAADVAGYVERGLGRPVWLRGGADSRPERLAE